MRRCMVDLETLTRVAGGPILSIGACFFDELGVNAYGYYREVKIDSEGQGDIDPNTYDWWMQQDPSIRDPLLGRQETKWTLRECLQDFSQWLLGEPFLIYGNGADFDVAILNKAYANVGLSSPWDARAARCYRTLKNLRPYIVQSSLGVKHHALHDAIRQAEHCIRLLNAVDGWRE